MSLIELAYDLLVERNEPIPFKELMSELASLQHLSKAEVAKRIAQFYTDLNVDGRFTSLGDNRWGLKTWYPVDQIEEEVVHVVKVKKKKKKAKKAAVVVDDFDEIDEEDLDYEEEIDDLDEDEDLDIISAASSGKLVWWENQTAVGVLDDNYDQVPQQFKLVQNYPNPFNPSTTISYSIAHNGFVSLKIYDVLGNEIVTLVNEEKQAGNYVVEFDANGLTSGIYFYELQSGDFIGTKKMILLK